MTGQLANGGPPSRNRWNVAMWGTAACLLLTPLVAMQFTDGVDWSGNDFIIMGAMLFAACGAYELAARVSRSFSYRAGAGIAIAATFLLVWFNLAVGIIGSENNRVNLVFAGVLAVAAIGSLVARLRPQSMARAMIATAIAQALATVFALFAGQGEEGPILSAFFVAVWLVSAHLFRRAGQA